jgi:hypothetical protein
MATEYIVGSSLIISVIDDRSLSQSTTQCAVSKQVLIVVQSATHIKLVVNTSPESLKRQQFGNRFGGLVVETPKFVY